MYDFQSAMADGKARAQRERNRGQSSAVRIVSTEEIFMGMNEDDWNDWNEEQASSVDDIEADMAIAELGGGEPGASRYEHDLVWFDCKACGREFEARDNLCPYCDGEGERREMVAGTVDAIPAMRPKREPRNRKTARPQTTQQTTLSGSMTAKQYVAALVKLSLSPYSAAPHLGISRSLSFRYAAGTHAISPTVAKLVRALVKLGSVNV